MPDKSSESISETLAKQNQYGQEAKDKIYKEKVLFFNTKIDKPYGTLRFENGDIRLTQRKDKKTFHTVSFNEDVLRDILHHSNQLHDFESMQYARKEESLKAQQNCKDERIKYFENQIKELEQMIERTKKDVNS